MDSPFMMRKRQVASLFLKKATKSLEYTVFTPDCNVGDILPHQTSADVSVFLFCLGIFAG